MESSGSIRVSGRDQNLSFWNFIDVDGAQEGLGIRVLVLQHDHVVLAQVLDRALLDLDGAGVLLADVGHQPLQRPVGQHEQVLKVGVRVPCLCNGHAPFPDAELCGLVVLRVPLDGGGQNRNLPPIQYVVSNSPQSEEKSRIW